MSTASSTWSRKPGLDDRPVLLVQRVRDREDELLLGRVVLVAEPVHARRRDHGEKRVHDVDAGRARAGSAAMSRSSAARSYVIGPVQNQSLLRPATRAVGAGLAGLGHDAGGSPPRARTPRRAPRRTRGTPAGRGSAGGSSPSSSGTSRSSMPLTRSYRYVIQVDLPISPSSTTSIPGLGLAPDDVGTASVERPARSAASSQGSPRSSAASKSRSSRRPDEAAGVGGQDPVDQSSRAVSGDGTRRRRPAARRLLFALVLPVGRARDAVGVLDQRHDQRQAAEQQRPVAGDAEPLLERVREQRLDRDQAGEERARDHRDPADVGEGDQAERGQRGEAGDRDRAEVVAVQRAADPCDERADREGGELHVADVDARRRRGPLVRAHGEHPLAEVRAAEVGDEQPERDRDPERRRSRTTGLGILPSSAPERRRTARGRCPRASARARASSSCRRPRSVGGTRTARSRPPPPA